MRHAVLGLGVLAMLGLAYGYFSVGATAADPVQTAKADVKSIERAVTDYCIKRGEYPPSLEVLVDDGRVSPDGLRDPWKHEYRYDPIGRKNKGTRPDIWTVTPAKEVIGNWKGKRSSEFRTPAKEPAAIRPGSTQTRCGTVLGHRLPDVDPHETSAGVASARHAVPDAASSQGLGRWHRRVRRHFPPSHSGYVETRQPVHQALCSAKRFAPLAPNHSISILCDIRSDPRRGQPAGRGGGSL